VALVIIASIGAIVVPYAKTQIDHTNATATASTHATTVASDATGTVVTQNAHATSTAQAMVAATAVAQKANPNPYPPQTGTLVLLEKMPKVGVGSVCNVTNGTIHATDVHPKTVSYCWGGDSYDNFAYDVEVTIVKGDCGGIIFREDGTEGSKEYMFNICQNGYNEVDLDQGAMQQFKNITYNSTTPGLHTGLNQMNVVGVVAQGQNFSLYVNKQFVTKFTDSTYGSGLLGVDVWNAGNNTDISFANQRAWKL
jgi:type II secretory pathway pseudopilin PulG